VVYKFKMLIWKELLVSVLAYQIYIYLSWVGDELTAVWLELKYKNYWMFFKFLCHLVLILVIKKTEMRWFLTTYFLVNF